MSADRSPFLSRLSFLDLRNGFYITFISTRPFVRQYTGPDGQFAVPRVYVPQIPAGVEPPKIDRDEISRWSRALRKIFNTGPPGAGSGLFI